MKRIMTDQNGFFHLFDPSQKSVQIRFIRSPILPRNRLKPNFKLQKVIIII